MAAEPIDSPDQLRPAALLTEYDGTNFHGLQAQENQPGDTIQEALERAAAAIGASDPQFVASGRTDAGVHAIGQVVRMALPAKIEDRRLPLALNAHLPAEIRIRKAATVSPEFNPRFDARQRNYLYRFCEGDPPPIYRHFVTLVRGALDERLTRAAADCFIGYWELEQWRSSICQSQRTKLHINQCRALPPMLGHPYWQLSVCARSFLHNQVRFMAGAVIAAGTGRLPLGELSTALRGGVRPEIIKKEAALGLCFAKVEFEEANDPFS